MNLGKDDCHLLSIAINCEVLLRVNLGFVSQDGIDIIVDGVKI
jgi:hypothetical protein